MHKQEAYKCHCGAILFVRSRLNEYDSGFKKQLNHFPRPRRKFGQDG